MDYFSRLACAAVALFLVAVMYHEAGVGPIIYLISIAAVLGFIGFSIRFRASMVKDD